MLEETGAVAHRVEDAARHEQAADRLVTRAQPFGDDHEIGRDAFLLARVQRAGASHAAHDFVEDEQHAVLVADLADALEIAGAGLDRAERRADDRLGDERADGRGPEPLDLLLELVRGAQRVLRLGLVAPLLAVAEARRDVLELRQQRLERLAAPAVAAGGERADRVAVIALPAPDDVTALGLPDLEHVLARHLERGFDAFGAAGVEVHALETGGRVGDDRVGERLGDFGGEERRVRIRELVDLALDRLEHARVAVAEARHGCTARGVEIAFAVAVVNVEAFAAHRDGQVGFGVAVEYVLACRHAVLLYSSETFAALMTLAQRAVSDFMISVSSACVVVRASVPSALRRSRMSCVCEARITSACSFARMSGGVPAGASSAFQSVMTTAG